MDLLRLAEMILVIGLPPSLFSSIIVRRGWGTFFLIIIPAILIIFMFRLNHTDIVDAASRSLVVLVLVTVGSFLFARSKRRKQNT